MQAFLGRVASTTVGARELVSLNCLASFNECKYIDCRPGSHGNQSTLQPHSSKIYHYKPAIVDFEIRMAL